MKIASYLRRPMVLCGSLAVAIVGLFYFFFATSSINAAEPPAAAAPTPETGVAFQSVCEAKKAKAADPSVEIPKEFDKPYPTLAACLSYDAASDPKTPGPVQPIPFSHKHHATDYQMACLYCHTGSDRSRAAGVPSIEMCMGCHKNFPKEYDQFEGIRLLKEKWDKQEPIEWVQIHRTAEFVKFRHNRHMAPAAGLTCQQCHGPVEQMDKVYMVPDPVFTRMPAKKLEMGWCISCHRQKQASQDCATCHY